MRKCFQIGIRILEITPPALHAPKHVKSEENGENSPATGWGGEEGLSAHPFQGTKPEDSWLAPLWLPTTCRRKVQELVPKPPCLEKREARRPASGLLEPAPAPGRARQHAAPSGSPDGRPPTLTPHPVTARTWGEVTH